MRALNQTAGIFLDSFLQFRRRLIVVLSFLFITLVLLTFLFGMKVERGEMTAKLLVTFPIQGVSTEMSPERFGRMMLGFAVFPMMFFGFFILLFSTSGLLPEILRGQGRDLLLSKPIPRWLFLSVRFAAVDVLVVAVAAYYYFGMGLIARLLSGTSHLWPTEHFLMILSGYQCVLALGFLFSVFGAKAGSSLFLNALAGFLSITAYTVLAARVGTEFTRNVWRVVDFLTPPYGKAVRMVTGAHRLVDEHVLRQETAWCGSALTYAAVVFLLAVLVFSVREHGK